MRFVYLSVFILIFSTVSFGQNSNQDKSQKMGKNEMAKFLSDVYLVEMDLSTAILYTFHEIFLKIGDTDIPSFVFSLQQDLTEKQKIYSRIVMNSATSDALLHKLQINGDHLIEATNLLIKAVNSAQTNGKLSSTTKDLATKCTIEHGKGERISLEEFRSVPSLIDMLPLDERIGIGAEPDSANIRLRIYNWANKPLEFVLVSEEGFADKLGFRTGDIVAQVNGIKPNSLYQFKKIIRANVGKNISVVVIRNGNQEKLKIIIPEKLPSE